VAGGVKQESKVYAYFDLILHRPLPEKAQIQNAKLVRQRTGDRFRYSVSFTVREPQVPVREINNAALGVDIGFRQFEDGRIRAAAIGGSEPEDDFSLVEVPPEFVNRLQYIDAIKGQLDESATQLGVQIKPLLKAGAVLPEEHPKYKLIKSIAQAPANVTLSFEKAYKLGTWIKYEKGILPALVEQKTVEWWRKHGRKYRELHNLRKKVLGWRKDYYRRIASELVKAGRPIGVEIIDLRVFAETKDTDNKLGNTARANRFLVAPSELLGAIENAAQRAGIPVVEVNAQYTSKTCSACGVINKSLGAESEWTCLDCGTLHDRDKNAAVNIARLAREKLEI
jgi:IS605 OrfB family transposase